MEDIKCCFLGDYYLVCHLITPYPGEIDENYVVADIGTTALRSNIKKSHVYSITFSCHECKEVLLNRISNKMYYHVL